MKYPVLQTIIDELTTRTNDLNCQDIVENFLATNFIKKVLEITTDTMKNFKKFCQTFTDINIKKYLDKEFEFMLKNNQDDMKLAIEYANGNKNIDIPLNLHLSYNQLKNKTEQYEIVYDDLLLNLKNETERKAKDAAINELHDLKFYLTNVQERLENYENKIVDAF